jgi:uncharacterized protein (TIGR00725 family)
VQTFRQPLIGVIGAGECDRATYRLARQVGEAIASFGFGLVCGGLGGVMEAASKGCRQNGGLTVGLLPQDTPEPANPYLDIIIPTGMGIMRNVLVVRSAAGLIAVGGRYGTLSELAFALQMGKPVVGINTWNVSDAIIPAENPHDAVKQLLSRLEFTNGKTNP